MSFAVQFSHDPRDRAHVCPAFRRAPFGLTLFCIELALRDDSRALADELEGLLHALSMDGRVPESIGDHIEAAMQRLEALLLHEDWPSLPFADDLRLLAATLRSYRHAATTTHTEVWPRLRVQLSETYEAVCAALKAEDGAVRARRPTNYTRSAFHVSSALFCLLLTLVVFTPSQLPWAAAAFAGTAWFLETMRRIDPRWNDRLMVFFRRIAHSSERYRVNSATWYMTSLVGLALTGSTLLAAVGVTVLGFADPVAGFFGRRFGRTRLLNGRTLEGTAAFFVVGTVAAFGVIHLLPVVPAWPIALLVAASASLAGALAELVSRRIDDNLSIPWSAAAGAAIAALATGTAL